MLSATFKSVAGLISLLSLSTTNRPGVTPVDSTMCYCKRRGVVERVQMRKRNNLFSTGSIRTETIRSNHMSVSSDAGFCWNSLEADE